MTAPLYAYGMFNENTSLVFAIFLGFIFGLFLERGGLGNPHKLTGVFYLRDFTVPKVMFTAILVAATGLYLLSDMKLLDMSRIWIVPAFFWPQIAGGALFGVGFFVSGYCPGTAIAGFASGRIDALVCMLGIIAGSLLFAVVFPAVDGFYMSTPMGGTTLPQLLQLNHWYVIGFLVLFAAGMFYLMERSEKNG
ncbi:MAG: DUF6691 family protein [Nitrospirota bacterium]|nr:DUF6691 family protein [Nitrospirota bacterium]